MRVPTGGRRRARRPRPDRELSTGRAAPRAGGRDVGSGRGEREAGFSLIETTMALGIIFVVILGLMASLDTGVRGLLTGRQRSGASALAKEIIEQARSVPFAEVGHDIEGDATLGDDPSVEGTFPDYTYHPEGVSNAEQLVASVDAHFNPHSWQEERDGTTYSINVYVTWLENLVGDDYKRLTVEIFHSPDQFGGDAVENAVRVSTLVYGCDNNCRNVSSSETTGVIDVDGGVARVSGVLDGVALHEVEYFFPLVHQKMSAEVIRVGNGLAQSAESRFEASSGSPSGCQVDGSVATCGRLQALTNVDNDGGTPGTPIREVDGPHYADAATVSESGLSLAYSSGGKVTSKGTVESCTSCSPSVGDGDAYPYASEESLFPDSASMTFDASAGGILEGSLLSMGSGGSADATFDSDPVTDGELVTSTAHLAVPAVSLITLDSGLELPTDLTDVVSVSAADVTATAQAGPTAAAPTVSGDSVTVDIWYEDSAGALGYKSVTFSPGDDVSASGTATFDVSLDGQTATVTVETTVETNSASTSCSPNADCTSPIEEAKAALTNWFTVTVAFTAVEDGVTTADLTVELDYGRVAATAGYVPAP